MREYLVASTLLATVAVFFAPAHGSAATECDVAFRLVESAQPIGMLSLSVDYSRAQGSFKGTGSKVACAVTDSDTSLLVQDVCGPTDAVCFSGEDRLMTLNLFSTVDVSSPADIARCKFIAAGGVIPTDSQFKVVTLSATAPLGTDELTPIPEVRVESIDCAPVD